MTPFARRQFWVRRQRDDSVRVSDFVLSSVGFVVEFVGADSDFEAHELWGTGFFVAIPSRVVPNASYYCFVTAKHVAEDLNGRRIGFMVNKKGGGVTYLDPVINGWLFHPADASVDVAVALFHMRSGLDILPLQQNLFLTPEAIREKKIAIGDEVFFPGLFEQAPGGAKRIMPLLRHGNVAMIPDERIQVGSGYAEVYLIEARSIGGISGSPVFARATVSIKGLGADGSADESPSWRWRPYTSPWADAWPLGYSRI